MGLACTVGSAQTLRRRASCAASSSAHALSSASGTTPPGPVQRTPVIDAAPRSSYRFLWYSMACLILRAILLVVFSVVSWSSESAASAQEGPSATSDRVVATAGSNQVGSARHGSGGVTPSCSLPADEPLEPTDQDETDGIRTAQLVPPAITGIVEHAGAASAPRGWRPHAPFGRAPPA